MSTLYISNTDPTSQAGVWKVSSSVYKYLYTTFVPGQDVRLDQVSFRTIANIAGQSTPNNFRVGLYSAGVNSSTPGSLISYLSGPSSPTPGAYNDYTASTAISLASGTQYWLGLTLSSDTGTDPNTRVKMGFNNGSSMSLGSGWTAPNTYYEIQNDTVRPNEPGALVYSLYATPVSQAVCFLKGTLILACDGSEKSIEDLKIGDFVLTSSGCLPVKWIARQTIRRRFLPAEKFAQFVPVRIGAGSLGNNTPKTDLLVSETHGIHVDGKIVNATYLVNHLNICKDSPELYPEIIYYFHLEFDDEVLVLANGVEACSYKNERNRRNFDNYPEFVSLYVDADATAGSSIVSSPRNCPTLEGHKQRVKRSWQAA